MDPYNKVYFCLSLRMLLFSSVMVIDVVGVLYRKITDSRVIRYCGGWCSLIVGWNYTITNEAINIIINKWGY